MGIDGDNLDVEQLIIANMGDADWVFGVELWCFNSVDLLEIIYLLVRTLKIAYLCSVIQLGRITLLNVAIDRAINFG